MSLRQVDLFGLEPDESLDEAGFRHVATALGARLGARRIGAGLYQAEAGSPIWPYHYHHGIEEWLYVLAGAPVLRDPAGERRLAPGDLVCFPSGHVGAHTVQGPGRFVIFATGYQVGPYLSVYPDSDKVSGPEGILLRSSAVGYWHGEGTAGPMAAVEAVGEPDASPPQPIVNLDALDGPATLGSLLGAELLDGTVVDVAPGDRAEPYHYTYGREEWLIVLAGTASLRHRGGEDVLGRGSLVCLVEGPDGARELRNHGAAGLRVLCLSTTGLPASVCYPEAGRWVLRNGPGEAEIVLHELDPGP